jgi:hypothetical protein
MTIPTQGLLPALGVLLLLCGTARAGPELGVVASAVTGDYGTGSPADTEVLALRFRTTGRVQFRAYLPAISAETSYDVVRTAFGPSPLGPEQTRQRLGSGDGVPNGGGNGTGGGGGGGGSGGGSGEGGGGSGGGGRLLAAEASSPAVTETVFGRQSGVGDLRLGVTSLLAGGGSRLYRLDGSLDLKAPTADADKGLGTGEWDARLGLAADRLYWSLTLFGGLGFTRMGDPDWIDFRDAVDGIVGLESAPSGRKVLWSGWVEGNSEVVPGAGARAAVGLGLRSGTRSRWWVAASAGLTAASEDFGVSFGLSWGGASSRPKSPAEIL